MSAEASPVVVQPPHQPSQEEKIRQRDQLVSELSTVVAILGIHKQEVVREQLEMWQAGKKMSDVQKNKANGKQGGNSKKK